ncbi:hypothetical protein T310_9318 [Rasamsonia emersonii CBS 393.64]|uniref:Uncharacterized protein n=1 Tax=Rasamsonia emersonii (strain ATCC 16479 / CBS 393.64 / IMI 116815) TaxID=1408163 RepID=A0A0F4YG20_RASE3|nr:hypothetical protein T310_9318 [Rasamsonia emersonii CBS 393.64]KKA17060.1 hypothetical protein T310_9318 [Rasamsonia emersonii CBS 393.64]
MCRSRHRTDCRPTTRSLPASGCILAPHRTVSWRSTAAAWGCWLLLRPERRKSCGRGCGLLGRVSRGRSCLGIWRELYSQRQTKQKESAGLVIGALTWKRLHQHRKLLPRHIQIRSPLHNSNDLGDDRIGITSDAATKPNDRDDAGGVALKVLDILLRRRQQVVRNDLALVVLKTAVAAHLLQADAHVRQLAVQPPPLAVVHGDQVRLAGAQLAEDDHPWARRVDARALVE